MSNNISSLIKSLLESESMGVATLAPTYVQSNTNTDKIESDKPSAKQVAFDVILKGKKVDTVYFNPGMSVEEVKKSLVDHDGYDSRIEVVEVEEEKDTVNEDEDIKLSPSSFRTLINMHIAEQMINESVGEDPDLEKHGLTDKKKLTERGKKWAKRFLPTIYAS